MSDDQVKTGTTGENRGKPPFSEESRPKRLSASSVPAFEDPLDIHVEQAMRWRLILGKFADDRLGYDRLEGAAGLGGRGDAAGGQAIGANANSDRDLAALMTQARRMDLSLSYIYDREHAARSHRQAGGGGGSGLSVPMWLKGVRDIFPSEAVEVMEQDALSRYGLTELVTDPEILRQAEPSEELVKAILQFKHMMKGEVLEAAREVVRQLVEQLSDKLLKDCQAALHGSTDPTDRPPLRTFRNTDWKKTILKNLKNWDHERQRLIAERIYFKHRQKKRNSWRIIVAVDQSGSMTDSLIHASVMAAIFSSLPSVEANLILWDDRYVDVSDMVDDPLEVMMSCQLGGGTLMYPAMQYSASLITEPEKTIFVLISDWYIWNEQKKCLGMAHELNEAGVKCIGLCALDAECKPIYDEHFARQLAGCGWFVAALTPKKLAEYIGKVLA